MATKPPTSYCWWYKLISIVIYCYLLLLNLDFLCDLSCLLFIPGRLLFGFCRELKSLVWWFSELKPCDCPKQSVTNYQLGIQRVIVGGSSHESFRWLSSPWWFLQGIFVGASRPLKFLGLELTHKNVGSSPTSSPQISSQPDMGPHTIITTILLDVMIGEILTDSLLRSQKTWHPSETHNYCIWLYHDKEWAQKNMTWILCSKSFFGTIHIPSFTKKLPCWCPCWCQVRQPTPPTFGWCKVPPPRSTSGYLQHHHGWHRWNWIAPEGLWPVTKSWRSWRGVVAEPWFSEGL